MKPCPRQEKDKLRLELAAQIKAHQEQGGQIEQIPIGQSTKVDMTSRWLEGFCIDDNVGFAKKVPYKPPKRVK